MAEYPGPCSVVGSNFTQVHFETARDMSEIHGAALVTDLEKYDPVLERLQDVQVLRLLHAAMGIVTEAGELMDMLKKHLFYGKPVDWANAKEELGDVSWYWRLGLDAADSSMVENLLTNVRKLKARYAGKFSEHAALNRNLMVERAILEGKSDPT